VPYLIVSDIHGNHEALEAALADAQGQYDRIYCLGDVVGYGADPNPVTDWTRASTAATVRGNHDRACVGSDSLEGYNPSARLSAIWTRGVLGPPARDYLGVLPTSGRREEIGLFHASPRDPVWEYVLTWEAAEAAIRDSGFAITLVGHSHVPLAIPDDTALPGGHAPGGKEVDLDRARWLLNPGSVGQPRDGDPAAAWLLLDLDEQRASFQRVEYDVERTQAEIRDRGLPDALAERLAHGV